MAKKQEYELVSKSIQFPADTVKRLEQIAEEARFTHMKPGVGRVGNVARIVALMVEYTIANLSDFNQWKAGGR